MDPSAGIFWIFFGGILACLAGSGEVAGGKASGAENGPGPRGFWIEADGVFGWGKGFGVAGGGEKEFAESFGGIGVLGIELKGLAHFFDGIGAASCREVEAAEEAVGFGIFWFFETGELGVLGGGGNLVESDTGHGAAEEKSRIVWMLGDDGGDGLFGFGVVLVEDGVFGGGDGGIEEGIFTGPFGQEADIRERLGLRGEVPKAMECGGGNGFGSGWGTAPEKGEGATGGDADDLLVGI